MTTRSFLGTLFFPFLCAAASSCGEGSKADIFAEPRTLAADSIAVGQIIRPQAFFTGDDCVAVQTLEDTVFYVYGLPDFRLRHTFGRRGQGPGEFPSLSAEQSGSDLPSGGACGRAVRLFGRRRGGKGNFSG